MAFLRAVVLVMVAAVRVHALAFESETDKPLDLRAPWSFELAPDMYVQHRCGRAKAKRIADNIRAVLKYDAEKLGVRELRAPLQVRLYDSLDSYRRNLRFSAGRSAHYNPLMNIVVAYCGVPQQTLAEQVTLYFLADAGLRPWQRVFLAENLRFADNESMPGLATKSDSAGEAALLAVLLSNHFPTRMDRQSLLRFARYLAAKQKLQEFISGLPDTQAGDDTALDLLDRLVPGSAERLLRGLDIYGDSNNNTLRKRKK